MKNTKFVVAFWQKNSIFAEKLKFLLLDIPPPSLKTVQFAYFFDMDPKTFLLQQNTQIYDTYLIHRSIFWAAAIAHSKNAASTTYLIHQPVLRRLLDILLNLAAEDHLHIL